ncbi:signal transducing kinase of the PAK [Tulasnella sp. 418]|nr:signal transducing kinase of the PAK [Tulasnella sp. 418]
MSKFLDEAMHVTGNTTSGNGGTSRFLAPEILKDQQKSIKSDVWAFGCVAIQILEGLLPYQHINNGKAVYIAIATGDVPMSSDYEPSTGSRELWNTIHSCWHAEPHSRPQITEFLNHLEESTPSGHSAESTKSEGLGEHQVESLFPGPVPTEENLRTAPGDGNQPMHSAQSNFSSDLESDCHSESNEEPDIFRPRPMPQPHLRPPDIDTINTVLHFPRTYWAMFQNWTYDQDEDSNDDLIELLRTSAQPFSLMDELTFSGSTLSDDNAAIHGRSVENSFEESQQPSASEVVPRVSNTDPRTLYRDLRRIGNEDAGPIFSARDRNGSAVTIKILSRCNLSNRDTIARHLYVLRTSMHRNIIRHIQSFYHERRLWVVMECLKGITLSALVQRSLRCFSEPQIALISREILQGVNYLHDRGLVLCNLPSCNIFVTLNGEVKLTSFGRCMLNECMLNDQTNNSTGFNQYYVASEIAEPGFDMWNLGIIAAEMLHGNSPLPEQKLRRILHLLRANKDPEGVVPDHRQLLNNYLRNVLSVDAHERPDGKTLLQDPFFDLAKPTVLEGLRFLVKAVTDCFEWSGVLHGR